LYKLRLVFLFLCGFFIYTSCKKNETADYHIGLMSGDDTLSEDSFVGGRELIARYGAVENGGIIQHVSYPDQFIEQEEVVIASLLALASDPKMKAIIVNQGIPGTAEAFLRIRSLRPDILLFVGEPHEEPDTIQKAADIVVSEDFISRGYLIPWEAKNMGADTFVHISFPRHMDYDTLGLRRQIMEEACKDLGLQFRYIEVPDPESDVGEARTLRYVFENTPGWVEKYGKKALFFCTNDAQTGPLLRQLFQYGGMFAEADIPSILVGYPEALDLNLGKDLNAKEDLSVIFQDIETAVVQKGGAGRFGTWRYPFGYVLSAGLGEFAKRVIDKTANIHSRVDLYMALGEFTPDSQWNGIYYINMETGREARNHIMVYMDTYIFGRGYLRTTRQEVPEKYFAFKRAESSF
jgi:hypothetical protein